MHAVIEATSYFSAFVAGHSCASSKRYSYEPECQTALHFEADFKQFIFSQSYKLFYSEALFKQGWKPLKIIWCMQMCVTEIENREKGREWIIITDVS